MKLLLENKFDKAPKEKNKILRILPSNLTNISEFKKYNYDLNAQKVL